MYSKEIYTVVFALNKADTKTNTAFPDFFISITLSLSRKLIQTFTTKERIFSLPIVNNSFLNGDFCLTGIGRWLTFLTRSPFSFCSLLTLKSLKKNYLELISEEWFGRNSLPHSFVGWQRWAYPVPGEIFLYHSDFSYLRKILKRTDISWLARTMNV